MNTIKRKIENNSTIGTKLDKHGNKFLMFESFKEVDDDAIIKEQTTSLSRDNITSLQADNVEDLDEIYNLLIILNSSKKMDER